MFATDRHSACAPELCEVGVSSGSTICTLRSFLLLPMVLVERGFENAFSGFVSKYVA